MQLNSYLTAMKIAQLGADANKETINLLEKKMEENLNEAKELMSRAS